MNNNTFRFFSFLVVLAICVWGCGRKKDGYDHTDDGLAYKFIKSSNGKKPALGDIMIMHINYRTEYDSILYDSKEKSDSFKVVLVEPTFKGGIEGGFALMSPGDSAVFKISADSLFEKTFHTTLPPYLKPGNSIIFQVRLKDFIQKSVYDSLELANDVEMRKAEFVKIEAFLKKLNMDVMPTENGAYMKTLKPGTGPTPSKGDTVYVTFTGRLVTGTIFDQSTDKTKPFHFVLGNNSVIAGWEECIPFLNKGSVARLVIPSDLGYGGKPYGKLPAYSTLVFDLEIIAIKPGKGN